MHHNQNQQGQNRIRNILKFDYYCAINNSGYNKSITLLSQSFNFFEYIPKDFTIKTQNGFYQFNKEMLIDTSSVIFDFITKNPNAINFSIDIKDDANVMSKIESMYNGQVVQFKEDEFNVLRKIISSLNINSCPNFMKQKHFMKQDYSNLIYYETPNYKVKINMTQLMIFLNMIFPSDFTISTNNQEYKCNKIGINSSFIIKEQLEKNPNLNSYHFDFDDEFNLFQLICDFFNFLPIEINTDNMDDLKSIIESLQINCLFTKITNIVESYQAAVQTIDDKHFIIDSIEKLCSKLYNIKNLGIESVGEEISMSIWSSTKENVQELVCYLIQIIHNDFGLHSYIMDLIELLDKNSKEEENELKLLIPYFIKQIMYLFPGNKLNCAFVFRLIKKGLISLDEVINKLVPSITKSNQMKNSKKDEFISHLTSSLETKNNINTTNLKNAIFWFFPELLSLSNKNVDSIINEENFFQMYLPNDIERYKKMRESFQPEDEITKSIINDDVDKLQSIIINHQPLTNLISFNLFEDFNSSIINYTISKGSIKCFKYLFLNHYELDESSFYYAVLGGNIEIIKIVDQYYSNNNININFLFNYDDLNNHDQSLKPKTALISPIIPAIRKHQNDIFDWILEQKFINKGIMGNYLYDVVLLAVQNGNVHALIQCVDKGFDLNSLPSKNISKIIKQSSSHGFVGLTYLLISLLEEFESDLLDLIQFEDFVLCGNSSILTLYFSINNDSFDIEQGLYIAIERGYSNIIKKIFESISIDKIKIKENVIVKAFAISIQFKQTDIFDYLFNHTILVYILKADSLLKLLSYSCHAGDLKIVQLFTDFILNKNIKNDFSNQFLYAACSGNANICQYFIDKKVIINYINLLLQKSVLTCCNKNIFNLLFNSLDPYIKESFLSSLLNESISNKNIEIIEFLIQKQSPYNNDTLFEAVLTRKVEIVDIVLKHNSKPSFINRLSENGTALNKAVEIDEYEIVKRLLSIPEINPNLYASNNKTPLVSAISNFNLDIINLILDFYDDEIESQSWQLEEGLKTLLRIISGEESSSNPYFPSFNSCVYNTIDYDPELEKKKKKELILSVLNRLIQIKNINLNCRANKYTLLTYACETNEIEMVSLLIKSETIDVNCYSPKSGKTPLMISIENKNVEIAKLLINFPKTNINIRNYFRKTALIIAVEKNLVEIVDLIVNNEKFDHEESLLDYAFSISKGQISRELFKINKLNVNYHFNDNERTYNQYDDFHKETYSEFRMFVPDDDQVTNNSPYLFSTSLIQAVIEKDQQKIDLIIKHPSFDPIKSQVKSALFASVNILNFDIFKFLLSINNNDVNICSQTQESLLSYSIKCGSDDIINEIINSKNLDPNKVDIVTAFIQTYSINCKQEDNDERPFPNQTSYFDAPLKSMKLLCQFGEKNQHLIDFTKLLPNDKSFFTIMNPNLRNNGDVAAFLLENGANPDEPDNFGEYPLKYFIQNNLIDAAIVLINSGMVNLFRSFTIVKKFINKTLIFQDITYLHLAASLQTPEILSALLDLDIIDINCHDNYGETPLIKAVKNVSKQNIELLFENDYLDYNENIDIIRFAKSLVNYESPHEVQLESKEDYLEYLNYILSYWTY